MDENMIRKYALLMRELGITGMDFREDGTVCRLERMPGPIQARVGQGEVSVEGELPLPAEEAPEIRRGGLVDVTSPMVGVFYAAPAENAEPFVQVGDRVNKGDVLCIIEAMKLMNELVADESGVVEEICVENGQVVDFGRVLFRLRKD